MSTLAVSTSHYACSVVVQLEALHLSPDLVVLSPLSRASETGKAYLKRRPELAAVTETWDSSHEMAFGDWDNAMVRRH